MKLCRSLLALSLFITGFHIQASPLELQKQFIDLMVNTHQFDRKVIESTLAKANKNQAILNGGNGSDICGRQGKPQSVEQK